MGLELQGKWALILGASSGFGAATARELARHGMNIAGVHLDRRATLPLAEAVIHDVQAAGGSARFFNVNAADDEKRRDVIGRLGSELGGAPVTTLMHSLAFGTLLPLVAHEGSEGQVSRAQLEMTMDVMAHSLVYWVQDLVGAGLLRSGSRVFVMTSAGPTRVWPYYGVVAAAKAAVECHVRYLAAELGRAGITVNAIRAGITDTPAVRRIPGWDRLLDAARAQNPSGRATAPEDVARVIALLSRSEAQWLTGDVVGVDGGELYTV